jgi:hypothetical protein
LFVKAILIAAVLVLGARSADAGCDEGFAGMDCMTPCAGGAATPCNFNGMCNQGTEGDGTCTCDPGFFGSACEGECSCSAYGTCNDGASGDGSCACLIGYVGVFCEECGPGFTGYPICVPDTTSSTTTTSTIEEPTTTTLPAVSCAPAPMPGCLQTAIGRVKILTAKQFLVWKGLKSQGFEQPATNDPATNAHYSLCVYDTVDAIPSLAFDIIVAPGDLWASRDPKGWKYKDKAGSSGGATLVLIKTGADDNAKVMLKAKGGALDLPDAATPEKFFSLDSTVTVQLANSQTGTCWTTAFTTARKNNPTTFIAAAP